MPLPEETDRKRALILDHETAFAHALASRVIDRPEISVWMVLLPLLLVYFFQRRKIFKTASAAFAEHYLKPRRRALEIVAGSESLDEQSEATPLQQADAALIDVLAGHYRRLLAARGDDYKALVLASYRNASEYRDYLDRLEKTHDAIDAATLASPGGETLRDTVNRLRDVQRSLYRQEVAVLFG
jgi:hypothetical protein